MTRRIADMDDPPKHYICHGRTRRGTACTRHAHYWDGRSRRWCRLHYPADAPWSLAQSMAARRAAEGAKDIIDLFRRWKEGLKKS
jgi:hypothetical protein